MSHPQPNEPADITIIGAGPVGLFAAYYAGMREASTTIVDILPELGGQLAALYPEKYIYDVAGFPKILAKELVVRQVDQAFQYDPEVILGHKVVELKRDDGLLTIRTDKARTIQSRTAIIAAGIGAFVPRKLDRIPDIERLEDLGVYYFVKDVERLRGLDVLVVGGGDSAVDWALALDGIARSLTLIHRRDRFRAHENSVKQLLDSSASVKVFHELKAVLGKDRVEGAIIFDNKTGEEIELEVQALLLNLGFLANLGPIKKWGLHVEKNAIHVDPTMATNMPGIYAAGDIIDYNGKLKLIATGAGEAAIAVNYAKNFIDPTARVFPGHSSNLEPPPGAGAGPSS